MIIHDTALPEVKLVEPTVHTDTRGFFLETFNADRFAVHGLPIEFRQDNHSRSSRGVLRGLHYQQHRPQGKLIGVVRGAVFDVAVDVRRGSPTFGRWVGATLTDEEHRLLWIPPGFAHGFYALSEVADVTYKCTDVYVPHDEHGVLWSDPGIDIGWPADNPTLSPKDAALPPLRPDRDDLPVYAP